MKSSIVVTILMMSVLFFFSSFAVAAEDLTPPDNWWRKSSLHPEAAYPKLLKKFEASISYNNLSGNTEGHALTLSGGATLRKNRITATLLHEHREQDIRQGDDKIENEKHTTALFGQYDLTSYLFAGAGYIYEKDTNNNIESRQIYFAGPGAYLLSSDRINLSLYAGIGRTKETYDDIVSRYTAIDKREYDIIYFHETVEWRVTRWLTLNQGFRLIQSFSKMNEFTIDDDTSAVSVSDSSPRSLIQAELAVIMPINRYLQYSTRFRYNYDSHAWPGNDSTDTTLTVGLNFKY